MPSFFKKGCSYKSNCGIRLHDSDLEPSLMKKRKMFFFPILFSGFPDLALGILKMPIRVCLHDVFQPAVY